MKKLISRWPAIAVAIVIAQALAALTLQPGASQLKFTVVLYFALVFLATLAATVVAVQSAGASRIFWAFIAGAQGLLWLINWMWVYSVFVLHRQNPFGVLHLTVFVLGPVALMAAATTYPHWKEPPQVLYRTTLNLVLLLFSWVFLYAYFVFPYWSLDPSVFYDRYDALYFAENFFLLVILGSLIVRSQPPWKVLYWHLFGASCLWTFGLQMQNFALNFRGYHLGGWLDLPSVASCCWFVWVPLLGMRLAPQLRATALPVPAPRKFVSLSSMLVVLAIPLIGAWEILHGGAVPGIHRFRLLTVLVSFVLMAVAIFAKEQIANRELVDAIAANLRFSEERFYKAFDSAPEGITISALADGRYIEVNDAFLRVMGYQRSEVLGKTAQELNIWCDPQDRGRIAEKLARKEPVRDAPATLRTKSGQIRHVEVSAESLQLLGEPCSLAITRDVTQHRLLEQQFLQAQKMEAVGRLAGGVAHDFNNFLAVILGYSELIASDVEPNPALSKKIETIKRACRSAAALTAQLLAFSRRQALQPKVLNLNSTVSETAKMLQRLVGEDIEHRIVLDPLLGHVKADPGQIVQVIMNLGINARDAMPSGGKLTIQTANATLEEGSLLEGDTVRPGRYVLLSVSDTGAGMDIHTLASIFEPFFTTKPAGKGTGLGLATVYGIVQHSGGYILVDSQVGIGTTFKVYLPRVDEAVEPVAVARAPEVSHGSETILLVEDDLTLLDLLVENLRAGGYKVLSAANGVNALKVAEQHLGTIDLLVTDVIMPQMSGPELAQWLVARWPGIKVLYMSGYTDDKLADISMSDPGLALIQKPFQTQDLTRKLREILGRNSHSTRAAEALHQPLQSPDC
jgi:two-component system, cell cycle sensor histidine kinase and response regulator CckA